MPTNTIRSRQRRHTSRNPSVGKDIYFMEILTHDKEYATVCKIRKNQFVDGNARILRRFVFSKPKRIQLHEKKVPFLHTNAFSLHRSSIWAAESAPWRGSRALILKMQWSLVAWGFDLSCHKFRRQRWAAPIPLQVYLFFGDGIFSRFTGTKSLLLLFLIYYCLPCCERLATSCKTELHISPSR